MPRLLLAGAVLLLLAAGPAPVPAAYRDAVLALDERLDAFDATVRSQWDGLPTPVAFSTEVLTANGARGRQLLASGAITGVRLELDRMKAMGARGATVAIQFPLTLASFHAWTGFPADADAFLAFYRQVATDVRARGLKLTVESGPMFPGVYSSGAGFDVGAYYPLLSGSQYVFARAEVIKTIARELHPDYLSIGSEPDTELQLTGQPLNTPAAYTAYINYVLGQLAAAGLGSQAVGAGAGTWDPQAEAFVRSFSTATSLAYIDLHVYPVNRNFLDTLLSLSDIATAAGKKVGMSEVWLLKARDSELSSTSNAVDPVIFARDPFRFWSPLDRKFLTVCAHAAHLKRFEFVSGFWSKYFYAYLDYDQVQAIQPVPTAAALLDLSSSAAASAIVSGSFTETATTFALINRSLPPGASVTAPAGVATSSPVPVSGALPASGGVTTVTWSNSATGQTGTATISGATFSADVPVTAGSNDVEVTMSDEFGNRASATVTAEGDPSLPPISNGSGGGGGGSGCGALGLDAVLLAVLTSRLRRRAPARSRRP